MQHLTHVYMDYNLLTNIDTLADCFCLVQVNAFGTRVKEVKQLTDYGVIVNFNPSYGD